jgi:hypothetical protein
MLLVPMSLLASCCNYVERTSTSSTLLVATSLLASCCTILTDRKCQRVQHFSICGLMVSVSNSATYSVAFVYSDISGTTATASTGLVLVSACSKPLRCGHTDVTLCLSFCFSQLYCFDANTVHCALNHTAVLISTSTEYAAVQQVCSVSHSSRPAVSSNCRTCGSVLITAGLRSTHKTALTTVCSVCSLHTLITVCLVIRAI